jgi:hypothetical protein
MKELFASVQLLLAEDTDLVDLLGGEANIGQAYSPAVQTLPCVAYQLWSNAYLPVDQASGNRDPQNITLLFSCYAKDDSSLSFGGGTLVIEIGEQLKALLHGADLGTTDLHCFSALFDDWQSPVTYDAATQEWRLDLRFRFVVAKQ